MKLLSSTSLRYVYRPDFLGCGGIKSLADYCELRGTVILRRSLLPKDDLYATLVGYSSATVGS